MGSARTAADQLEGEGIAPGDELRTTARRPRALDQPAPSRPRAAPSVRRRAWPVPAVPNGPGVDQGRGPSVGRPGRGRKARWRPTARGASHGRRRPGGRCADRRGGIDLALRVPGGGGGARARPCPPAGPARVGPTTARAVGRRLEPHGPSPSRSRRRPGRFGSGLPATTPRLMGARRHERDPFVAPSPRTGMWRTASCARAGSPSAREGAAPARRGGGSAQVGPRRGGRPVGGFRTDRPGSSGSAGRRLPLRVSDRPAG